MLRAFSAELKSHFVERRNGFLFGPTFGPMTKRFLFLIFCFGWSLLSVSQENISAATGVSVLRNLSPQQGFWAVGHTLQATVHFSATQSAYAWIEYYTDGRYKNDFSAVAKSPLTLPQRQNLTATGRLTYRHFSLGWKHYFSGSYRDEKAINIYGLAGFGFLFARVQNSFSTAIDTSLYRIGTTAGEGTVRKLTFDLGLGGEKALTGNFFVFADVRTWLPASSNESKYLHNQRNLPLPVMLTAGVRVLLGSRGD